MDTARESTREQIKAYLQDYVERITEKSKGKNMYVCPLCGSGTGKNKTGAFCIKDNHWNCFACGQNGDIFDLVGAVEGLQEYSQQFERLKEIYNMQEQKSYQKPQPKPRPIEEPQTDFTNFFLQANKNLNQTTYHRGITIETLNRYKVGFVADWKHPKKQADAPSPRLIIPITKYSYIARYAGTGDFIDAYGQIMNKAKVKGAENVNWIFNAQTIDTACTPVFIVEGELDALSIIDVGGDAVGLGSIANVGAFLHMLKGKQPKQPFVVALDNENNVNVQKKAEELKEGLKQLGIQYYSYNPYGQHKDANDALQADRESFKRAIEGARDMQEAEQQAEKEKYMKKNSVANHLQEFVNGIADSVNTPYISTGFKQLDIVLDGGLYEGLYIIGAISSLGKTTLVAQIADQIAQNQNDVLIISLEMARSEIMSKSISRETLLHVLNNGQSISNAKTARGITTGAFYPKYSNAERETIQQAITNYGQYAKNIYIIEGIGNIGVEQVREAVKEHIHYTGKAPVVIIDYIQILAPYNDRATDKQNTDKSVMELKRISRDYKTPVIGISSFNRTSYKEAVDMTAFKESGRLCHAI